jgi:integrase
LPRALAPDIDRDLMAAVTRLPDPFARIGLTLLRGTGIRLGELLDLELDCVWDSASHGSWLKVPVGKLGTERTVPLDADTLAALDEWMTLRGPQRALPHPRTQRPADFLFVERGRRPTGSVTDSTMSPRRPGCGAQTSNPCRSPRTSSAAPTRPVSSTPACRCRR